MRLPNSCNYTNLVSCSSLEPQNDYSGWVRGWVGGWLPKAVIIRLSLPSLAAVLAGAELGNNSIITIYIIIARIKQKIKATQLIRLISSKKD